MKKYITPLLLATIISGCGSSSGSDDPKKNENKENKAPTAIIDVNSTNVYVNDIVSFHSASIDADGSIASQIWKDSSGKELSKNQTIRVTMPNAGSYTVKLEVIDDKGKGSSTERTLIVKEQIAPEKWDALKIISTSADGNKTLAVASDEENLYFEVNGTNNPEAIFIYIDSDNYLGSGLKMSFAPDNGFNYLLKDDDVGDENKNFKLYELRSSQDWAGKSVGEFTTTPIMNGSAYRFIVSKSLMPSLLSDISVTARVDKVNLNSGSFTDALYVQTADIYPPIITFKGNIVPVQNTEVEFILKGKTYTDSGAIAYDIQDKEEKDLTSDVQIDTSAEGSYGVTYTATDKAGNSATRTKIVTVFDISDTTRDFEFTKELNSSVIIDKTANLMWSNDTEGCFPYKSENATKLSIEQSCETLNTKNYAGYTNWRVPTVTEMVELTKYTMKQNKSNDVFYIDPCKRIIGLDGDTVKGITTKYINKEWSGSGKPNHFGEIVEPDIPIGLRCVRSTN
jgi:hypothetical protein